MSTSQAEGAARLRQTPATIYDSHRGGRMPFLDGPRWLIVTSVVGLAIFVFGSAPWTWIALPVVVAVLVLPFFVSWGVALRRSVTTFREGLRD